MDSFPVRIGVPLSVFVSQEGGLAAVAAGGSSIADKSPEEDPGEAAADPIVGAKESTEMSVLSDATTKNASGGSLYDWVVSRGASV